MALNNMGFGFTFTARDLASTIFTMLERRFASLEQRIGIGGKRIQQGLASVGAGMAMLSAGGGMVRGMFQASEAAGVFEQSLVAVGQISGATAPVLDQLRMSAIRAGLASEFSPQEAVNGLRTLAAAGMTATESMGTLEHVLGLATASMGKLSIEDSAAAIQGTMASFGLGVDQAGMVADKLGKITMISNFQPEDFAMGLSKAAAVSGIFQQSVDDTLILMGLMRRANIDASSAMTALKNAFMNVGASQAKQLPFVKNNIDLFDRQTNSTRSLLEAMIQLADRTRNMPVDERNEMIRKTMGMRGITAFSALDRAEFTDRQTGQILKGMDAIRAMRRELENSQGTTLQFRDALNNTFQGQKTLLKGAAQTLVIAFGTPIAKVLKPLVTRVLDTVKALIEGFNKIPEPIKRMLAGLALGTAAMFAVAGAALILGGAMALLGPAIKVASMALRSMFRMLAVAALKFILPLVAVVLALKVAWDNNLGGMVDIIERFVSKVGLAWRALRQLFTQGGFSGAVNQELLQAENRGLERFVVRIYMFAYRIQRFLEGVRTGFVATVKTLRPVFDELVNALKDLGETFANTFSGVFDGATNKSSSTFARFGKLVGSTIAGLIKWPVKLITILARLYRGILQGAAAAREWFLPAFERVGAAMGRVREALQSVWVQLQDLIGATGESEISWTRLGNYLGQFFGGVVTALTYVFSGLIDVLAWVLRKIRVSIERFKLFGQFLGWAAAQVYLFWTDTLPQAIDTAIQWISGAFNAAWNFFKGIGRRFVEFFHNMAESIGRFFQPVVDFFIGVARTISRVFARVKDMAIQILRQIPDELLPSHLERLSRTPLSTERASENDGLSGLAMQLPSLQESMPAVAQAKAETQNHQRFQAELASLRQLHTQRPPQHITTVLQVDGQELARTVEEVRDDAAARAYHNNPSLR